MDSKLFWELKRNGKVFLIALLLPIVIEILYIFYIKDSYELYYAAQAWEMASQIGCILLPIVVAIPACVLLFQEKKSGFFKYVSCRETIFQYVRRKYIAGAIYGFLIGFLVSLIVFLACQMGIITLSLNPQSVNNTIVETHFYGKFFVEHPFIYGIALSVWRGVIGALYGFASCVFAMYVKQMYVALLAVFAWVQVTGFILAIVGKPQYALDYSFEPEALVAPATNIGTMLISVLISMLVVSIYKYKMEKNYEVFD